LINEKSTSQNIMDVVGALLLMEIEDELWLLI
jgi:hypothetical protein